MIARAAASVILAGALVLGTAGCSFFATQQTTHLYDASDGVGTVIGDLKVRNVIALVGADGKAVSLIFTAVNDSNKAIRLNLGYDVNGAQDTKDFTIGAGKVLNVGYDKDDTTDQLIIIGTGATAGGLLPIFVQYGDETGETLLVPVLDGSLPEYKDLVAPQILRETPTVTLSPTPVATETPAP
ncbi:MAG: hypothetical protein ABJB03_04485 [Rhodoglobus sp.]